MKKNERLYSTSGGIAYALMEEIVNQGGYVYGVAFDENLKLVYKEAHTLTEIQPFRGSKYVQASTGKIYRKILVRLNNGDTVLFIGLPCQTAALKCFLGREYSTLTLVDLICHGVPSQKFNREHVNYIKGQKKLENVSNIKYRKLSEYSLTFTLILGGGVKNIALMNTKTNMLSALCMV